MQGSISRRRMSVMTTTKIIGKGDWRCDSRRRTDTRAWRLISISLKSLMLLVICTRGCFYAGCDFLVHSCQSIFCLIADSDSGSNHRSLPLSLPFLSCNSKRNYMGVQLKVKDWWERTRRQISFETRLDTRLPQSCASGQEWCWRRSLEYLGRGSGLKKLKNAKK